MMYNMYHQTEGGKDNMFDRVLHKLQTKPVQLEDMEEWLFVTVNTMKAVIDNSKREDIGIVKKAAECGNVSELQRMYDMIQGKYGRDGFSYRNSGAYHYLSSLVARFSDAVLTEKDREDIRCFCETEEYLLYRI